MSGKTTSWDAFRDSANINDLIMLPGESHEKYEDLLRKLHEDLTPNGIMEEIQVLKMTKAIWTRQRTDRYVQLKMHETQLKLRVTNTISHHVEKLKLLAPKFLEAVSVKEVEELLDGLEDPLGKQLIVARWPLEKCNPASTWGSVIAQGLSSTVPDKRFEGDHEFFKMVDTFPIDEDFSTLERMDATIDRTLKRLMQLKTMKQMFRQLEPKLIENHKGSITI
jgi:hypothetical protein